MSKQALSDAPITASRLLRPHTALLGGVALLVVINSALGFVLPWTLRSLVDRVMLKGDLSTLPKLIGLVVLATCGQALAQCTIGIVAGKTGQTLIADLRMEVAAHVNGLPVAFFDANRKGSLAARIMKDAGGMRDLRGPGIISLAGALASAALACAGLFFLNATLALVVLTLLTAAALAMRHFAGPLQRMYETCAEQDSILTGRLTESLSGVRVVKAYAAEPSEARLFAEGARRLTELGIAADAAQGRLSLGSTLLLVFIAPVALSLGAHQVAVGKLTMGGLATFTALLFWLSMRHGSWADCALSGLRRRRHSPAQRTYCESFEKIAILSGLSSYLRLKLRSPSST